MGINQWGILCCLLAGCVVQPTETDPQPQRALVANARPVPATTTLRIGLEFLAPEDDRAAAEIRVESTLQARSAVPGTFAERPQEPEVRQKASEHARALTRRHTWTIDARDLAAMPDPVALQTLHFLEDLLDEDRASAEREVRVPFFDWQHHETTDDPMLASEFAQLQARDEWIHEHGPSLLKRPFKRLLRRTPWAQQVEVAFEDWRSENVPLSAPYQQMHGEQRHSGRVSLRVRTDDWADPLEISYVRRGVRVGTSQDYCKFSWDLPLAEKLRLEVRTRHNYRDSDYTWRCNLIYQHSPRTSLHLSAGDDLDFLSTSSIFSLFESPMDGQAGVIVYAVHVF